MSKSLGNVVNPFELASQFGADGVRYYLLKDTVYGQDSAVGADALAQRYNADLANDLGNLLSRARALICRHLDGVIPQPEASEADRQIIDSGSGLLAAVRPLVGQMRFDAALEEVMQFVRQLNRYFNDQQPWVLARQAEDRGRLGTVLYNIVEGLRIVSVLMEPAIPAKARQLRQSLGLGEYDLTQVETWGLAPAGSKIPDEAPILFPKIEIEQDASAAPAKPVSKKKKKKEQKEAPAAAGAVEIGIDDFAKVELRVALVKAAEKVAKADKLLKLTLALGAEERIVVSGIAQWYKPEDLPGKKVVLVANLKPAKLRGIVSQGMILAAEDSEGNLGLVEPDQDIEPGALVR